MHEICFPSQASNDLHKLSQDKSISTLSYDSRVPVASIEQYLHGKCRPSLDVAYRLEQALGVMMQSWCVAARPAKKAVKRPAKKAVKRPAKKAAKKAAKKVAKEAVSPAKPLDPQTDSD